MSTSEAVARPFADPDVYPYFVLRHMSTVYSRRKWYVEPEHLLAGGLITEEGREEFVEFVAGLSARTGKRACAVFGPDDAVYCEPDGSRRTTDPGERAPDGYTYIQLRQPVPDEYAPPRWYDHFRTADREHHIWSVHRAVGALFVALTDLGVDGASSIGGFPGGRGGTDVSASPFLDGGIHRATRDGFVCGAVSGVKVLGERALAWCCHVLELRPPRRLTRYDGVALGAQIEVQVSDGSLAEPGELLARARSWQQLRDAATELSRRFEETTGT